MSEMCLYVAYIVALAHYGTVAVGTADDDQW